jgi:hypothetical protein
VGLPRWPSESHLRSHGGEIDTWKLQENPLCGFQLKLVVTFNF